MKLLRSVININGSFCKLIHNVVLREMREELSERVAVMGRALPGFQPGLAIVQVGGREDSNVYIRMKVKAANEIGIFAEHIKLPRSTTEAEVRY